MKKKGNVFVESYRALITPDASFSTDSVYSVPRIALIALIVVLVAGGSLLSLTFHQNETFRTLTLEQGLQVIERRMATAPAEVREEAIDRVKSQMDGTGSIVQMITAPIVGGGMWLIMLLEGWFLLIILMQFLGGEEQELDQKKHRRSYYLVSYALIPIALQEFVRGLVLVFKDPTQIGNVLTLAEYTDATEVSFSLLSLFDLPDLPGVVEYLVYNFTNPFFLWALAVGLFGGIAVFRVKAGKMAIAGAIISVVFALQAQLLQLIQGGLSG